MHENLLDLLGIFVLDSGLSRSFLDLQSLVDMKVDEGFSLAVCYGHVLSLFGLPLFLFGDFITLTIFIKLLNFF